MNNPCRNSVIRAVPLIKSTLDDLEIEPSNLELEITESLVMDDPQIVVESLTDLKIMGSKLPLMTLARFLF